MLLFFNTNKVSIEKKQNNTLSVMSENIAKMVKHYTDFCGINYFFINKYSFFYNYYFMYFTTNQFRLSN